MDLEDIERERIKYVKLRGNVVNIISNLKSFNSNVINVKNNISNNYTVNGEGTPVLTRVTKLANNSDQIKNHLSKVIIPAIDSAIKKCDSQIAKLKAAEAAAATEARAAAAKAKASSVTSINA